MPSSVSRVKEFHFLPIPFLLLSWENFYRHIFYYSLLIFMPMLRLESMVYNIQAWQHSYAFFHLFPTSSLILFASFNLLLVMIWYVYDSLASPSSYMWLHTTHIALAVDRNWTQNSLAHKLGIYLFPSISKCGILFSKKRVLFLIPCKFDCAVFLVFIVVPTSHMHIT